MLSRSDIEETPTESLQPGVDGEEPQTEILQPAADHPDPQLKRK